MKDYGDPGYGVIDPSLPTNRKAYILSRKPNEGDMVIKVDGTGLHPEYPDQSAVVIAKASIDDLENGDVGVFLINGNVCVLRRFYKTSDEYVLSLNDPTRRIIRLSHDADVKLLGKAVETISKEDFQETIQKSDQAEEEE